MTDLLWPTSELGEAGPDDLTAATIGVMSVDLVPARVTTNSQVRSGQPIIRGTRITVWDILGWLGGGVAESEILADYPELTAEDIRAALQVAYQLKDRITH